MARVVAVHGIGKQVCGEETLLTAWWPAMADGLRRAGADGMAPRSDVAMAFYGDVFRPAGELRRAKGRSRQLLPDRFQAAAFMVELGLGDRLPPAYLDACPPPSSFLQGRPFPKVVSARQS